MCGIIGYKGDGNAGQLVHSGLKKLTYRGYDSWGFGFKNGKGFDIIKDVGDVEKIETIDSNGTNIALGHCRWATHGGVTKENAHPHTSCDGKIAVVHNGIIENYQELKKELVEKGHKFLSETDTEVIVHLIEEYSKENDFPTAVKLASARLEGLYSFVVANMDFDGIIGVKNGSPLVIGVGENENFFASDVMAFIERTKNAIYLNDGEMAIIK
jgi:glucosamine--fructose-6-phosphate aminotransferase (isomerizing)